MKQASSPSQTDDGLQEIDFDRLGSLAGEHEPQVQLPAQMELFQSGSGVEIVQKWFSWMTVFLTVFTVIWTVFTVIWVWDRIVFSHLGSMIKTSPWELVLPVVGVFLVYYSLASWLNRTHILVSREKIAVRQGRVPCGATKNCSSRISGRSTRRGSSLRAAKAAAR